MKNFTGGSRFYTLSPFVLVASIVLAVYFDDSTTFITVATTWMALAGAKSGIGTLKGNGGEHRVQ